MDLRNRRGRVLGTVDGLEAVHQAACLALLSVRFKTLVFSTQYGSDIESIIGWDATPDELIAEEIDRAVRDALSRDERIISVDNVEITQMQDDYAHILVEISTIYGKTTVDETVGRQNV